MKNAFYLLLFLLLLINCGPPRFEKDIRVLVKGNVLDENNGPISDAEISVRTRRPTSIFDSNGSAFLLGRGYSLEDGRFEIISLFDKDKDFSITINSEENLSSYTYSTNTENYLPNNLEFDLQTVSLKRLATLNYSITRTTNTPKTTLQFSFTLKSTHCSEFFENGILLPLQSYCFEDIVTGNTLNDVAPDITNNYKTLLGITVVFKYSINNAPETTETFIIDKENYDFNFSY